MTALDPAMLWAVLADPADNTVRLACADWLDENAGGEIDCCECQGHGNYYEHDNYCPICSGSGRVSDGRAERAEFIRVQVKLARLGSISHPNPTAREMKDHRKMVEPLCLRESELFKRVPLWWDMGFKATHWSRGFVSEIELTCEQFMHHAPAIFAAHPVTSVTLTDREPVLGGRIYYFVGHDEGRFLNENQHFVPMAIRCEMDDYRDQRHKFGYKSSDHARAALSAACVQYARALVGLPPLPARPAPAPVPDEVMR